MTPPTPKDELPMCTCGDKWHADNAANHAPSCPVNLYVMELGEVLRHREKAIATHTKMLTALLDTNATADDFANLLDPEWFEFAERIELLRALLAERDALKAPTPQRRLRENKGVQYRDGKWHWQGFSFHHAAFCIASWPTHGDDADHAALLALRDDPWEKVETLEDVVLDWWRNWDGEDGESARNALCTRLRAWLATQEPTTDPLMTQCKVCHGMKSHAHCTSSLTLTDHINALVKMGALYWDRVKLGSPTVERNALILPADTEPTP